MGYTCRGGAEVKEHFTFKQPSNSISDGDANFSCESPFGGGTKGTSLGRTCKVGNYPVNPFGIHDMHGNVLEWCSDWYSSDTYKEKNRQNPQGPQDGKYR